MNINLNLAGDGKHLDTLYAACMTYAMQQRKILKNAVIPYEHNLALDRLAYIELILDQLDSLPANQEEQ
jgi:hypothetical protein